MTKKQIAEQKRMLKERALIPIPEREIGCMLCDSKPKIKNSYHIPMTVEDAKNRETPDPNLVKLLENGLTMETSVCLPCATKRHSDDMSVVKPHPQARTDQRRTI